MLPSSPYKFLDYYTKEDRDIFFGREKESRILLSDIVVNRLVVLTAKTGTGKTSIINAGVRPRLEERDYKTFFIRVRKDPVESARVELARDFTESPLDGQPFPEWLEGIATQLRRPIVLCFDQFEEFFIHTFHQFPAQSKQFIADVAELFHNRQSRVHILFSMREEWFVWMDEFRDEIPEIFHNESNLRLRWFDQKQAREAIVMPPHQFGVEIASEVADYLISTLMTEKGVEPAQLQIVCDKLWRERCGNTITMDDYRRLRLDGLGAAVAAHILYDRLEGEFDQLESRSQLELLDRLLRELRTPREPYTKYVRDIEGLIKDLGADEHLLLGLIDRLEGFGFIRKGFRDNLPVIELTHDYLIGYLDELRRKIQALWPRRKLREAINRYELTRQYPAWDELDAIAGEANSLEFTPAQAEFLLRSGLALGNNLTLWCRAGLRSGIPVWSILREKITTEIPEGSHAVELLRDLAFAPGEAGPEAAQNISEAFALLRRALERDDLTLEAQGALARLTASPNSDVASQARTNLLAFLETALAHGRVAFSAIEALGRAETKPSISFLEKALKLEDLTIEAQKALVWLRASNDRQVASDATAVLLAYLKRAVQDGRVAPSAIRALGQIETSATVQLLRQASARDDLATAASDGLQALTSAKTPEIATAAREALASFVSSGRARTTLLETEPEDSIVSRIHPPRKESSVGSAMIASLARAVQRGQIVLFLGPAVHVPPPLHSEYAWDKPFPPSPSVLAQRLAEKSAFPFEEKSNLQRVALYFEVRLSRLALMEEVKSSLELATPSPVVDMLASLPFRIVVTTNYDRLLERALMTCTKEPNVIVYNPSRDMPTPDATEDPTAGRPLVFKIHGDLEKPDSIVITEEDYLNFVLRMSDHETLHPVPQTVRYRMHTWPTLVIGCTMRDFNFRLLWRMLCWGWDPADLPSTFFIDPFPDPLLSETMHRGANVIREDLWTFVPKLYDTWTSAEAGR